MTKTWTSIHLVYLLVCLTDAEYYVLLNGDKANEGNVQINNGSTWFDLCTDGWDDEDATVVCRMLGYTGDGSKASIDTDSASFSSLVQYKFDCDGSETSLQDCQTSSNDEIFCNNSKQSHLSCVEVPQPNDFLLISFGTAIAKMDRASGSLSLVQAGTLERGIAITYDNLQDMIIWTDVSLNQMARCNLNGGNITVIYQAGNESVMDGIAMDVNSRLIFYTDTGYDEIGVINADTLVKTIVIDTNLDEPRAIVLDTQTREMFWTDWGANATIEKSNYDGSNRTIIVSTGLGWPNAMVLDGDVLIWCDAMNDIYERVNRNGTGRTSLATLSGSHCFDFTIYGDHLYVNDWVYSSVIKIKKDGTQASLFGPSLAKRFGIFHFIKGSIDTPFTITITPGLEERVGPIPNVAGSNATNLEIKFEHNITLNDDNATAEQYLYDINWYINDNLLTQCSHGLVAYTNLSSTHLMEECWRGTYKLSFLVRCEIRLRDLTESSIGPFRSSESFKAGFTTDKNSYIVEEGSSIDILITLTVPLGCVYLFSTAIEDRYSFAQNECRTQIATQTPITTTGVQCSPGDISDEPVSFEDNFCGVDIFHNDWNTTKILKVYGASDGTVNMGSRSSYIRLEFYDRLTFAQAWEKASIPDILVVVQDEDSIVLTSECYSNNDPHMKTFDGRLWENQRLGEYVLYHNPQKLYWVHAMFQSCRLNYPPGPTCNCGVAVRNNVDVFVVNFCDAEIGWYTSGTQSNRYEEKTFCDDTSMIINKMEGSYTITLPTGTKISFEHFIHYGRQLISGISIKPSLADWKTSSGLCGYLDGDRNNDFVTRDGGITNDVARFASDWKVTEDSESLFGVIDLADASLSLPRYCKCRSTVFSEFSDTIECSMKTETVLCSYTDTDSFFKTCDEPSRRKRSTSHHRYRRSLSEQDVPSKFKIVYTPDADDVPEPPTWRNGWNETLAEEACRTFIQNQKFLQKCEEVLEATANFNEAGVQSCIIDIKLTGTTEFMQSTVDNLARSCRMIALKLENLTQTTAADGTAGQTVLDVLLDLDCRNNCSGNGICQQGKCQCFDDFEGDVCSTKLSLPPVVSSRTNPGLCKRDAYPCNTFFISGSNFAQETMTCKAAHFQITETGYHMTSVNDTFPAELLVGGSVCACSLSDVLRGTKLSTYEHPVVADGFFLSLSNDGITYSDDVVVIIYDSSCQKCNATTISCTEFAPCITTP